MCNFLFQTLQGGEKSLIFTAIKRKREIQLFLFRLAYFGSYTEQNLSNVTSYCVKREEKAVSSSEDVLHFFAVKTIVF